MLNNILLDDNNIRLLADDIIQDVYKRTEKKIKFNKDLNDSIVNNIKKIINKEQYSTFKVNKDEEINDIIQLTYEKVKIDVIKEIITFINKLNVNPLPKTYTLEGHGITHKFDINREISSFTLMSIDMPNIVLHLNDKNNIFYINRKKIILPIGFYETYNDIEKVINTNIHDIGVVCRIENAVMTFESIDDTVIDIDFDVSNSCYNILGFLKKPYRDKTSYTGLRPCFTMIKSNVLLCDIILIDENDEEVMKWTERVIITRERYNWFNNIYNKKESIEPKRNIKYVKVEFKNYILTDYSYIIQFFIY
jgi:hypothetical protein